MGPLALAAHAWLGRREAQRLIGRRVRARRPRPRRMSLVEACALCLLLGAAGLLIGPLDLPSAPEAPAESPPDDARMETVGSIRVIDGDTLDLSGERVRLANIDAPEMPPKSRCASEADGALRAAAELKALVGDGDVTLQRTGTDRYGRTLGHVSVDGADVGRTMIAAGLVRPWEGRRRSWCAA